LTWPPYTAVKLSLTKEAVAPVPLSPSLSASIMIMEKLAENLDIPIFSFFLTDNSIYYDNIMLARIEKRNYPEY